MITGPTIEGELLERMRNVDNIREISPDNEKFSTSLDTIMNLAEIATQTLDRTIRIVAINKLREINPHLRIIHENGKSYLHG